MSQSALSSSPAAPFAMDPAGHGAPAAVVAHYLDGVGVAFVQCRSRAFAPFAERVAAISGAQPSPESGCVLAPETTWVAVGPGAWLAIGSPGLPTLLQTQLVNIASVADQSSGYVILRLTGSRVRETLAKLIPIDLHPRAFPVGAAASSVAAHIAVTVWRCHDGHDGSALFELTCLRSFSANLVHSLRQAAGEFGFELRLRAAAANPL